MGLALLLRLEKIPLFCWAAILIFFGVFLVANEQPFSVDQLKVSSLAVIGIAVLIYDLRKSL